MFELEVKRQNFPKILEFLSGLPYTTYKAQMPMNCFLFIAYALQWAHGRDPMDLSPLPRLPEYTPRQNPELCKTAFKQLFGADKIWPGRMIYNGFRDVEMGDIIISTINNVPGHMLIVENEDKVWHSNTSGTKISTMKSVRRSAPTWHYRTTAMAILK